MYYGQNFSWHRYSNVSDFSGICAVYTSWDSVLGKTYLLLFFDVLHMREGSRNAEGVKEMIKGRGRTAAKRNDVFVVLCSSENEKETVAVGRCQKDVF